MDGHDIYLYTHLSFFLSFSLSLFLSFLSLSLFADSVLYPYASLVRMWRNNTEVSEILVSVELIQQYIIF